MSSSEDSTGNPADEKRRAAGLLLRVMRACDVILSRPPLPQQLEVALRARSDVHARHPPPR